MNARPRETRKSTPTEPPIAPAKVAMSCLRVVAEEAAETTVGAGAAPAGVEVEVGAGAEGEVVQPIYLAELCA